MAPKKKKTAPKRRPLSSTRPKTLASHPTALPSSQASRALIRRYHTLEKQLAQALSAHDDPLASSIRTEIERLGGLQAYQRASIAGQSAERGGDTSKLLMKWLAPVLLRSSSSGSGAADVAAVTTRNTPTRKLRLLEVGALSPYNACAKSGAFEMERIDLQSQHPSIKQQDFMERPVPRSEAALAEEGFDVVSLSLVLNFVPNAAARGEMLKRVSGFLRTGDDQPDRIGTERDFFPGVFVVLPGPCVLNSRYLNEERLEDAMKSLGYQLVRKQMSKKLASFFWKYEGGSREASTIPFKKEEVRKGAGRNNFAIVLS